MAGIRRRSPAPWRLVYRHAASGTLARMDFLLDLLQGAGLAAAIGIRPFLPVLLAGALASADVGLDFDGTDFAFLEEWPFLLGVLVLVVALDFVGRRAGATLRRPAARCSMRCRDGARARCLLAAGSVADRSDEWWAGRSRAWRAPRSASRRALAVRPGPAPARRPGGAALPVYARARRWPPRAVDPVPAARAARHRRAHLAARGRAPPRRREVRRPAHPSADRRGAVGRSSSSPSSTR